MSNRLKNAGRTSSKSAATAKVQIRAAIGNNESSQRPAPARYNTIALLLLLVLALIVAGFSMWLILRRH